MNLDDALDKALTAAITHFAIYQALKQQALSEGALNQYVTEGLQKKTPDPQNTHAQAAQVLDDIRRAAGTEMILIRAAEARVGMDLVKVLLNRSHTIVHQVGIP